MKTSRVVPGNLAASVMAVPPFARDQGLTPNREENLKLIKHIEAGGITTLLYGGNANFYNVPLSEYGETLEFLCAAVSEDTWLIPSAGPDFGRLIDQAEILRVLPFPTVMALPQTFPSTPVGTATGLRRFCERLARPIIIYVKSEDSFTPASVQQLFDDGLLCCVKYAIERPDPTRDEYLRELVDRIDPARVVSGIGERPAVAHVQGFGLAGFSSGLACIAPRLSTALLRALQAANEHEAERLRKLFLPLEYRRDTLGSIRVMHDAVTVSGIADMGPILPLLDNLDDGDRGSIVEPVQALVAAELALRS